MKRLLIAIAAAGMLLLTSAALAQTKSAENKPPPLAQTLVREGDFALDLAVVLKLGDQATETEAEDTLTKAGVSPKNGWIADYPVTPDILGEIGDSIGTAADSGTLKMKKDEALMAFNDLAKEYGLPVRSAGDEKFTNSPADTDNGGYSAGDTNGYEDYYGPSAVEEYYYDSGPPVVTYYYPPPDYYYLYSWVPYPFWWYDFWYPGYFMLNDFSVVINTGHHHHHHRHRGWDRDWDRDGDRKGVVSNHVKDKGTNRTVKLDPVTRKAWKTDNAATADRSKFRRDASRMDRKSAESIVERGNTKGWKRSADRDTVTARTPVKSGGKSWSRSSDSGATVGRTNARAGTDSVRRDRSVDRPARLGDASRDRGWNDGSSYRATPRDSGRSFERATRIGDSSRGSGWDSGRSGRSASGDSGRSFSSSPARSHGGGSGISRGGGGGGFSRGGGGGGFNRGGGGGGWGGGGGCRGKNC